MSTSQCSTEVLKLLQQQLATFMDLTSWEVGALKPQK